MALENSDINWILDLVTAIEQDLQSLNIRVSNAENVIKTSLNHITNILQNNSDILDNAVNEAQGIKNYTTNLSKKVLSLKENTKEPNNKYYIDKIVNDETLATDNGKPLDIS